MTEKIHKIADLPEEERERLQALRNMLILDTQPEIAFDRLTKMAAHNLGMPISLVSLVDVERQWFKSHHGIDARETHRDLAFCAHVILDDKVMVVADAAEDSRFAHNPLVTQAPHIRFYAGAPLITAQGQKLGTFCVIDRVPHPEFGAQQQQMLADYAAIAMDEMQLRHMHLCAATDSNSLMNTSPMDLERLQVIAETLPEKQALLGLFFSLMPQTLDALRAAIENMDTLAWRQALHGAKGMAGNLGMVALSQHCARAELASSGEWSVFLQMIQADLEDVRECARPFLVQET